MNEPRLDNLEADLSAYLDGELASRIPLVVEQVAYEESEEEEEPPPVLH